MEQIIRSSETQYETPITTLHLKGHEQKVLQGWKERYVRTWARLTIFFIALRSYRSLFKAVKVLREFIAFNRKLHGDKGNLKIVQCGRKYHFALYAPAFPSRIFNGFVKGELNRIIPVKSRHNALSFIFFAITRKCPLQCEHCFEWDNLNGRETFTMEELKEVVHLFQQDGVSQFHLSGGEPMVRIKDLEELIAFGREKSEFWVLTSGFNLTAENAQRLKKAGATGVVISLDHFNPQVHNAFRGLASSYDWVLKGIQHAREQDLVVALSLCTTREFTTWENLMTYTQYARGLGVAYIQLLEPKPVGHYAGKRVTLSWQQLELLEEFYTTLNHDPTYKGYPVIIYHGYHQRRMGCQSAGLRNIYIDSVGTVNACPFCHTHDYNVKDKLSAAGRRQVHERMECPLYE